MKNFEEFLATIRENPIWPSIQAEIMERDTSVNFKPTIREELLEEKFMMVSGLMVREYIRCYHEWANA